MTITQLQPKVPRREASKSRATGIRSKEKALKEVRVAGK